MYAQYITDLSLLQNHSDIQYAYHKTLSKLQLMLVIE